MNLFNRRKKSDSTLAYLKQSKNLKNPNQIADQFLANEEIITFSYNDDVLYIINEPASLYHIVHSTSKMEKLANASKQNGSGIVLDIGANVGLFSYYLKKHNSDAKIFLFEPDSRLIPVIRKNLAAFSNFEIVERAISDTNGIIQFYNNPNSSQTNSTELDAVLPFEKRENIVVKSIQGVTLSSFCETNKITSIDTLKIDIQGSEFKVLQASESVLKMVEEAFVEVCFLMPNTIPLIKLMDRHFSKHIPITEIIMGADLKFYN